MSQHESLWHEALLRQVDNKRHQEWHWKTGLRRLLPLEEYQDNEIEESTNKENNKNNSTKFDGKTILRRVQAHLGRELSFREVYRKVFSNHIQFVAPIFIMPCAVELGENYREVYGLHLFEPRYRYMVRDLLNASDNPQTARRGAAIRPGRNAEGLLQPPYLIHFCLPQRLRAGAMACLVQVVWCRTYEHDTADVQLLPVSWIRLESVWVRPEYGHLFYAKATRL